MLLGTDHAHYDWLTGDGLYVPIDYQRAYNNGSRFAILKVVNGAIVQEHSVDELTRANASPLYAMPYMWPYPVKNISAASQAAKWFSVMRNFPGMTIALDAEETPGYPNPQGSDHKACILEYWKLVPGQRFMIYSRKDYLQSNGFNDPFFAQFDLWIATSNNNPPTMPICYWTKYAMYQPPYGSLDQPPGGVLPPEEWGVGNGKKKIDIDYFNGTPDELAALFSGAVTPEPPGETMKARNPSPLTLRNAPYVALNTFITLMPANTQIEGTEIVTAADGSKWLKTTVPQPGYCASWLLEYEVIPPVVDTATITVEHNGKTGTATIELQ